MEVYQPPYADEKRSRYVAICKLGEGTFGEVKKAKDTLTGQLVAVKHIRLMSKRGVNGLPKAVFRECEALRQLSDAVHIVRLLDVYGDDTSVCLVMEHLDHDLAEVILTSAPYLPVYELKAYFWMMIKAVSYCHAHHVIHRDIKPSNFLITSTGLVKLADFGMARIYEPGNTLSHQVCTRQYRPPELLFASHSYTPAVDIWGLGVIFVELITLKCLFPGANDIDQMFKVFQVTGTPDPLTWPEVEELPDYCKVKFPDMSPMPWALLMPHAGPEEIAFIDRFVQLNPSHRITAEDAQRMDYFFKEPLPCEHYQLNHHKLFQRTAAEVSKSKNKEVKDVASYLEEVDCALGLCCR